MTAEQKEILKALHVLKKTCEENDCYDCPLHRLDNRGDCAVIEQETFPAQWLLKSLDGENEFWTPFEEENE